MGDCGREEDVDVARRSCLDERRSEERVGDGGFVRGFVGVGLLFDVLDEGVYELVLGPAYEDGCWVRGVCEEVLEELGWRYWREDGGLES
jgi:hypothetical protein